MGRSYMEEARQQVDMAPTGAWLTQGAAVESLTRLNRWIGGRAEGVVEIKLMSCRRILQGVHTDDDCVWVCVSVCVFEFVCVVCLYVYVHESV